MPAVIRLRGGWDNVATTAAAVSPSPAAESPIAAPVAPPSWLDSHEVLSRKLAGLPRQLSIDTKEDVGAHEYPGRQQHPQRSLAGTLGERRRCLEIGHFNNTPHIK